MKPVSGKRLVDVLRRKGWVLDRIQGSHYILKNEAKTVTVPVHGSKELKRGTFNSIAKHAELVQGDF
jgi:predicted RNA binding protein YcfA (HicA-like mRNA interferase family)